MNAEEKKNELCDFCNREKGLRVLLTKKNISSWEIYSLFEEQNDSKRDFLDSKSSSSLKKYNDMSFFKNHIVKEFEIYLELKERYNNNLQDYEKRKLNGETDLIVPNFSMFVGKSASYEKIDNIKSDIQNVGSTLSTLRSGYLYVYHEHISRWEEYLITEDSYLKRIDNHNFFGKTAFSSSQDDTEPCDITSHKAEAMLITIPKPEKAEKVWFYYSEVAWSLTTKLSNKKNYQKFMHAFDVRKFLNSGNANNSYLLPHIFHNAMVSLANSYSSEYSGYLSHSWHGFNVDSLKEDLKKLSDKELRTKAGAVFTIEDTIGNVIELSELISEVQTYDDHYSDNEKTLESIDLLGSAFMRTNNNEFLTVEEQIAVSQSHGMASVEIATAQGILNIFRSEEEILEEERKLKKDYVKGIEQDWLKNYLEKCIDREKYNSTRKSIQVKKKLKEDLIKKLDHWLSELWCCRSFKNQWLYNYERNLTIQGISYVWNVAKILLVTPNLPNTLDVLLDNTTKNLSDKDNCLMQAFCLNNDAIHAAMASSLNHSTVATMPWGDLLGRFNAYIQSLTLSELKANLYSGYNILLLKINPVIEYAIQRKNTLIKKSSSGNTIIHPATIGMAAIQGKVISEVNISYKRKDQFVQAITAILKSHYVSIYGTSKGFNNNQIGHLVSKDVYWLSFYEKNEGKFKKTISIPVITNLGEKTGEISPESFFKTMTEKTKNMSVLPAFSNHAEQVALHLRPSVQPELLSNHFATLNKIALTGGFLLQSWALMTMWNDPNLKSTRENFYEKDVKLAAGLVGVGMATTEATAYLLNVYVESGAQKNIAFVRVRDFLVKLTNVDSVLWRSLGATIGFIFASYDFYSGYNSFNEGEKAYGGFLMISGGLTFTASGIFLLAGASNPFGWILIVAGIGFGIIAHLVRDNDLQKWLHKSLLGKPKDYTPFQNYDEQFDEYEKNFIGI